METVVLVKKGKPVMNKCIFSDVHGNNIVIENIEELKKNIIDHFETYWMQGSGDGFIEFYSSDQLVSRLMLGPNIKYGLYLNYEHYEKRKPWEYKMLPSSDKILLSLYDREKLHEVAETADEIYASVGLFLPKELAWEGIYDFIRTGEPSPKINWITPADIPDDGNY